MVTYQDTAVSLAFQVEEGEHQRCSQEVWDHSGPTTEFHSLGGEICPQDSHQSHLDFMEEWQEESGKKKTF